MSAAKIGMEGNIWDGMYGIDKAERKLEKGKKERTTKEEQGSCSLLSAFTRYPMVSLIVSSCAVNSCVISRPCIVRAGRVR